MKITCERCGVETSTRQLSRFCFEMMCPNCIHDENNSPLAPVAYAVELREVRKGTRNYEGIGRHWVFLDETPKEIINGAMRWLIEKYDLNKEEFTMLPTDESYSFKHDQAAYDIFKTFDTFYTNILPNILIRMVQERIIIEEKGGTDN